MRPQPQGQLPIGFFPPSFDFYGMTNFFYFYYIIYNNFYLFNFYYMMMMM